MYLTPSVVESESHAQVKGLGECHVQVKGEGLSGEGRVQVDRRGVSLFQVEVRS